MQIQIKQGVPNPLGLSPNMLAIVGIAMREETTVPPIKVVSVDSTGQICATLDGREFVLSSVHEIDVMLKSLAVKQSFTPAEALQTNRVFFNGLFGGKNELRV